MIQLLLRRIGLATMPPPDMDEQNYAEAAMENAVIDSTRAVDAISKVAKASGTANAKLRAGIDRMKISSGDPAEVVARASHQR